MSAERWDRLVVTLAERASLPEVRIDAKPYPGGTSRSITLLLADGGDVHIGDTVWRKNPQVWTGWQVVVSNRESIVTTFGAKTKKRGEVADQVRAAVTAGGGLR